MILEQPVCEKCKLRFRRAPKLCPGCGELKVLAFYDQQRRPACAGCTDNPAVYACPRCGREDKPFGQLCAPCTLTQRLTDLLTDPTGALHPQLRPVFDALTSAPRPQSVLNWLTRKSSRPDILTDMAAGRLPISHAAFEAMPTHRAITYVHDMLAATGVIEPYHSGLEAVSGWLTGLLVDVPPEHAEIINRFTRWDLLHRLRLHPDGHNMPRSCVTSARSNVLAAVRFLTWLNHHGITPAGAGQNDLEHYLATHPGRAAMLTRFLVWANRIQLTRDLAIPQSARPWPEVVLSNEQRWQHVELLLHDDAIRLYARITGLFLLLFAQPLRRSLAMRTHQIATAPDGPITVTFDTVPIELPEPLGGLAAQQLVHARALPTNHSEEWLFPGRQPGRHLVSENVRHTLAAHGIHPAQARKAAMLQLAAETPTPVLADILGLSPITATRWAALTARDWSNYTATRRADINLDDRAATIGVPSPTHD